MYKTIVKIGKYVQHSLMCFCVRFNFPRKNIGAICNLYTFSKHVNDSILISL